MHGTEAPEVAKLQQTERFAIGGYVLVEQVMLVNAQSDARLAGAGQGICPT